MKRDYRGFLIIHALLGALLLATPVGAIAAPHGSPDGGDVLKPGKRSAPSQKDGMRILLGPDAGATWASFTNGPANFALTNPYISQTYAETNHQYFLRFLNFTANKGDGWGLAIGGAADFLFTRVFGISAKLGYHTRHGNFSQDVYSTVFAPGMTAHLRDAMDWTFNFINLDLLLRLAIPTRDSYTGSGFNSVYFLAGPSFNFLISNTADVTETILEPADLWYNQDIDGQLTTINQIRHADASGEVEGFEKSRMDLKLGIGVEYAINDRLSLTPEITVAIPTGSFVKSGFAGTSATRFIGPFPDATGTFHDPYDPDDPYYQGSDPSLGTRYFGQGQTGHVWSTTNADFNMTTVFLTLGVRWRIN